MKKYVLLILLLTSCASKKEFTSKEVQKDSLVTRSFEYVSQPISTQIVLEDICDSLGNVRPFKQAEISGNNSAKVTTKDNNLTLDLFTGISQTKTDTIIKYKYRDKEVNKELVRYKTPFFIYPTFALLIGLIIYLLNFTGIYSTIKKFILSLIK